MNGTTLDEAAIFDIARRITDRSLREDYVAQICGNETALKARVDALLGALDAEPSFLNAAPFSVEETIEQIGKQPSESLEKVGQMIGNFKLMEKIGEGGFGNVYVAEQERPVRRKVALKVIKPGMDSKEVIARFEAERQALALMDHPHIAKVLDAGETEAGRPYFVMELVKGIPVTEYCEKKKLNTKQRLELFIQVCQAMQHAHQKGVIHRDVKPSNVLVTEHDGTPTPKVIDFGVAKAIHQRLTENTIYTRHQQIVGTPLYMSPEQAELSAFDVDTRTDIYSLGVLLYELLTGTTPIDRQRFRDVAYDEIRRIIREEEPPKPSTRVSTMGKESDEDVETPNGKDFRRLGTVLRGDLDWIVMKALEKDRGRRYESASSFADDIKRHLEDEPVLASPPSAMYRMQKFVRRRKGVVTAVAAIFGALLFGLSLATQQYFEAVGQKELADQERQKASEEAENARVSESVAKEQKRKADEATVMATQKQQDAEIAREEAKQLALAAENARAQAEKESEENTALFNMLRDMLTSTNAYRRSQSEWFSNDPPPGLSGRGFDYTVREMLDDFSETLGEGPARDTAVVADIWKVIGEAYGDLGDFSKSRKAYASAIEAGRQNRQDDPIILSRYLADNTYSILMAGMQQMALNADFAESLVSEAIAIRQELEKKSGENGPPPFFFLMLANAQAAGGKPDLAEATIEEGSKVWRKNSGQQGTNGDFHNARAFAIQANKHGRAAEVIEAAESAMQMLESSEDQSYQFAMVNKVIALREMGRLEEADDVLSTFSADFVDNPGFPTYGLGSIPFYYTIQRARTLVGVGRQDEAFRILKGALATSRSLPVPVREVQLLLLLGDHLYVNGRTTEALEHFQSAAEVAFRAEGLGPQDVIYSQALMQKGLVHLLEGDVTSADVAWRQILPFARNGVEQTERNSVWLNAYALPLSFCSISNDKDITEALRAADDGLKHAIRPLRNCLEIAKAKSLQRLGRTEKALDVVQNAIQDRNLHLTTDWILLEKLLFELLAEEGRLEELDSAMRAGIAYRESHFTPQHPFTLLAKAEYVNWLLEQQRVDDVEALLPACQDLAEHSDTTEQRRAVAIDTLIRAYQALGKEEEVSRWQKKKEATSLRGDDLP